MDARRTTGFVVTPYTKRQVVDSTLHTTSSFLRTMDLLLGLPPMSQYDAAANPMYGSLGEKTHLTPFTHLKPMVDVNVKNTVLSYGAKRSKKMNFKSRTWTRLRWRS